MKEINRGYLSLYKKFRINRSKLVAAFIISAMIVTITVVWCLKLDGITVTSEAFCGLEEHSHHDACYVSQIVCGYDDKTSALTMQNVAGFSSVVVGCDMTEAHVHTDACYQTVLVCTQAAHTHSHDCFPDYTADVESQSDWLAMTEEMELTDSVADNLVLIADSQLGYTESSLNFKYDAYGCKKGYTRYGEWYGNPYGNWNAMFVSFCLRFANTDHVNEFVNSGAEGMLLKWEDLALLDRNPYHEVKVGELLFVDDNADGMADSVMIVSQITGIQADSETTTESYTEIKAIIGDFNDCVEEIVIEDRENIIGYGLTCNLTVVREEDETSAEKIAEEMTDETTEGDTSELTDISQESMVYDEYESADYDEKLRLFEMSLDEEILSSLDALSREDRNAVIEVAYAIDCLPSPDEFFEKLDEYYENGDEDGESEYYTYIHEQMIAAYARYQGIELLEDYIFNLSGLFELKEYFGFMTFTTGTSSAVTFNYINRGWNSVAPVVIYGGSASEIISTGSNINQYWYGIVVEYDTAGGYYYVSQKYEGGSSSSATTVRSLEATTSKGFVIFIWMADTSSTATQQTAAAVASAVVVGDRVTVSVDPTTLSTGYSSSGYGTVIFCEEPEESVPEEPEGDPVVEDVPLESIQDGELSDTQVKDAGGITTSFAGDVEISKTIDGTDIENVFDITLTVRTESSMQTFLADPDMAVVIVMDISNTMNSKYPSGSSTSRYDAAVVAAENFINQFAERGKGISKLGFVAFNTHAHEILSMQTCTTSNAAALIREMKSDTEAIIDNYGSDDRNRFTNVEGGLKMGYDMLASSGNTNQYIIFLSDGFPTTYLVNNPTNNTSSFYEGYDPYTSSGTKGADGVFYDYVTGYYCSYGTSYSDKASIKARVMATTIKSSGAKIFSIGVDVGSQTIAGYDGRVGLSVIDRTGTTYEIGDASSTSAYQNWLRTSIGSGYYYDSTNQSEITDAFNTIFAEIESLNKESRETIWTTTDPLPVLGEDATVVEFINFFDKDGNPVCMVNDDGMEYIDGEFGVGLENTAFHREHIVYWDLKDSGYETGTSEDGTTTYYYFQIRYRVRLYNENLNFIEYTTYNTNGDAFLEYKTVKTVNDVTTVSDNKVLHFDKPAVEGYYAEFEFFKQSELGDPLEGAEFTLVHDDESCSVCHGNGQPVTTVSTLGPFTSQADGSVSFMRIPSGHIYTLTETQTPVGYLNSEKIYKVTVALDELSIRIYKSAEDDVGTLWDGDGDFVFTNVPYVYVLPETGGLGILPFATIGIVCMSAPFLYIVILRKRKKLID